MKKIVTFVATVAFLAGMLTGCATINSGATLADNGPIGKKMGEATSTYVLGLWSSKGEENNIKKAAENGGITKVSQVEYVDQSVFFGIFIRHTTRVYGE